MSMSFEKLVALVTQCANQGGYKAVVDKKTNMLGILELNKESKFYVWFCLNNSTEMLHIRCPLLMKPPSKLGTEKLLSLCNDATNSFEAGTLHYDATTSNGEARLSWMYSLPLPWTKIDHDLIETLVAQARRIHYKVMLPIMHFCTSPNVETLSEKIFFTMCQRGETLHS